MENAADAFYLIDRGGMLVDVNRHACLDLGYGREELLSKPFYELSCAYSQEDFARELESLRRTRQTTLEDRLGRKDGSSFPVEIRICHVESDGDLYIALARDISERKRQEQALKNALAAAREARDNVDNILASVADGVIVVGEDRRLRVINAVAERFLGFDARNLLGLPFTRLFVDPELRSQVGTVVRSLRQQAGSFDLRLPVRKGQFPRVVQVMTSHLTHEDGTPAGIVALLHDVSKEREIDRVKSEFISTAAHELRTPLSVVLGYAELIPESPPDSFTETERRQFVEEIFKKGVSLSRIVDDLFDISRIEAGLPLPLEVSDSDIDAIVTDVVRRFVASSPGHAIRTDLRCGTVLPCDEGKMVQVLENLVSNAVKYSPDGGVIRVVTECQGPWCTLYIQDHGIGMTPEEVDKVFDKYYRADSASTAIGGLGIGMSIVKAIVEKHGGKIHLSSRPGEGTLVTIQVPMQGPPARP